MELSALKPDEIEVECEIRGISTNSPNALDELIRRIKEEIVGTGTIPHKMHAKASKRPDIEIEACRTKLLRLQHDIASLKTLPDTDKSVIARAIVTRLVHVRDRLDRARHSPTYKEPASGVLKSCEELLSSIKDFEEAGNLDRSIETATLVEIPKTPIITPENATTSNKIHINQIASAGAQPGPRWVQQDETKTSKMETPDQKELFSSILDQLNQINIQLTTLNKRQDALQAQLDQRATNDERRLQITRNSVLNSVQTIPESVSISTSTPTQVPPSVSHVYPSDRRPLSRSGISYSGASSGINVEMFLFQLDTVVSSMKITEEALLCELHTLLKDVALQWYWTYRKLNPRASWSDIRRDLIERFKDRRTNYEIRRMVEARKQQSNESFVDFYHHVWNLTLQCRTPYSDEELTQILINNMKPALQYHLTDRQFPTINDLIKSCTAWEDTFKRLRTPIEPAWSQRRAINEVTVGWSENNIEPDPCHHALDARSTENPTVAAYHRTTRAPIPSLVSPSNVAVTNTSRKAMTKDPNPICFNCSDIGHLFKNCPVPPTGLFCYRCGLKGTISSRCNRCSENQASGPGRSGNQRPPVSILPRVSQEDAACNTDWELPKNRPFQGEGSLR